MAPGKRRRVMICANMAWNLTNFRASLISALQHDGFDVIAVSPADPAVERLKAMGCTWLEMPMDSKGTSPLTDGLLLLQMARLMRRERPAAYLSYTIKPNIYGALAARLAGVPAFPNVSGLGTVFIRSSWVTRLIRRLYRLAFDGAARVFFQNPEDRALFEEMGLVAPSKAITLPGSGIDLQRFAPVARASQGAGGTVFLLIARLLGDKGVREYVEAARIVRQTHPDAIFRIAGPVDVENRTAISRAELESWVAEGLVDYVGALDDVRPAIGTSDCVVLPSYREGAPRALIEAAAMARATIATDVPGCRHVVEHGRTGLLCAVRDAADLARAMDEMIRMGAAGRDAMGAAGRAMVEARYDEQLVISAYRAALADAGVSSRP